MSYNNIEFAIGKGVAVLKLNRPDALNSFTAEMHGEVREVLTQAATDKTVRALLLTGNGRGFCAGQDLNDRAVAPGEAAPDLGDSVEKYYNPLIRLLTTMEKPVICAVNGVAAGAGANIALACDIVIAARSASFIESFAKLGLIPDSGGTWHLPRLVGMARAKGLAMLGPRVSAEQALAWGMIWQVVEDEQLMSTALELAEQMATQPTRGFAFTKRAFAAAAANTLDAQLELEKELMRAAGKTHDYKEGVAAFLAKRAPVYKGE
ncbi:MAG: 2-(1,2-epoxy-1,2-dihydrophenyl)acetyl-CoA isomerase [Halioglobus sp.]|nr:2-(1,2-epoxy-1,2-dihydrophenyl)acetyl-CoA isomerase [Halioglobus sp.]MCB1709015.1 2-(1,2-epoxy-1,2-dihydrophenyl)acetyl-CoA isomerase [Halioglobus sp.]MCP5122583.1 2-(1,2-epoxy-1,2-dihydrophenyl)acetyl-CoA isomerase [Pseudomonadales bacterium]MCP5191750.1 2-(1,2-epoxy-1,2-dihydrophenyl)acetyl-CoA isomerase [Pseudomonadales bacterium]